MVAVLAAAVGGGMVVWAASLPGSSILLLAGAFWAWVAAGLLWVGLAVFRLGDHLRSRRPRPWWGIVAPVVIVVVSVGLTAVDAPLRARWAVSRSAFAAAADDTDRGSEADPVVVPDRLGTYRVSGAHVLDGGLFFTTEGGGGLMSAEGFAHLPDGPSERHRTQYEGVTFRALGDGWYAWSASV